MTKRKRLPLIDRLYLAAKRAEAVSHGHSTHLRVTLGSVMRLITPTRPELRRAR